MKLYKNIMCATAIGLAMTATGCSDFLDSDNKSSVTDTDYFSTESGFKSLVYDSYAQLTDIFSTGDTPEFFNAGTDLYQDSRRDIDPGLHRWQNFNPQHATVLKFYTQCYDGIRSTLQIQHYAPSAKVSADVKQKAIDEGRFINSMFYYLLVNNYGGVPLVTEYASTAVKGYPVSPAKDIYAHIIDQLTEVIANNKLVPSSATQGGGEASIESAKALLAKTYLSAAWDLNRPDYFTEAARLADEVIAGRTLTADFADLWAADYSGDDNAEFLFDIEYSYEATHDKSKGNAWQSYFSGYYGGQEEGMKNGSSDFTPNLHALKCFEPGDKRYSVTFLQELLVEDTWDPTDPDAEKFGVSAPKGDYFGWYKNGNKAQGKPVGVYYPAHWESSPQQIAAWRAQDPVNRAMTFVIPMDEKTAVIEPWKIYYADMAESTTGVVAKYDFDNHDVVQSKAWAVHPCRKFDDSNTAMYKSGVSFRDVHVITLPEVFLVASEAYLKGGQPGKADDRLNALRRRAGLSDKSNITIDDILKEGACEMFGNGFRRMDLRRTQKLIEYNNLYNPHLKGSAAEVIGAKTLWPIPQAAIDANDMIDNSVNSWGY